MQQNKFQKINNNSSSIVDVHLISHYILDQIIGSCTILLQEHFIINSTPKYTEFATIMLLNNLIKHYIDVPFEMNVTQDEEPLPPLKDSYSGVIQVDPQKKDIEIICEKELTRSTKFLRQSSRMKSNSVSVVVTMNRSTYKKQTSKKQSIEVVKLDEPNQQIDEKEQYFRYQHELKCKMLEQIARNEKRQEEDRAKQKNQLEQLKKKQNYANCGYDYDGSILPYNKPFMQVKLYHLQSKILKKKQDKKKQDNKSRVENIYIRNQTKLDVQQMSQLKFEEDLRQSQINRFESGLVRNMNGFSKIEKLDLLKNDSSLRMTKKQYEETSEIVYTESFVNLHKQHTNIEDQIPDTKSPIANNIKAKVSSQRDGEIKYQQQNYQFLLTEPDEDREINLQGDVERQQKLRNKEQYHKQNTQQLVSFANEQGKLPALKKSQQNKLNEKFKRSQTQHC